MIISVSRFSNSKLNSEEPGQELNRKSSAGPMQTWVNNLKEILTRSVSEHLKEYSV